jgi:hypothetical protein
VPAERPSLSPSFFWIVFSPERALFVLALVAVTCTAVPAAHADGDPASDYLISQQSFAPFGNGTSTKKAGELERLLLDAKRQGFPLKVAVIASPYDLGSVPSLFRQPKRYARFLGQEDFYFFKNELLVVMPNGYGLYKAKTGVPPGDEAVIAKLPPPNTARGDALIDAAEHAAQALAERRGLKLSAAGQSTGGSSANRDRVKIVLGVLVAAAVALGVRLVLRRRRGARAS